MKNNKTKSEAARLNTSSTKSSKSSMKQKINPSSKNKNGNIGLNSATNAMSSSKKSA